MTVSSKIRIYDLAKELKLDTKRLIEEMRREGVDVSVPSNSVSKELAERIRNKYFPKKERTVKRGVRVVRRPEPATYEPFAGARAASEDPKHASGAPIVRKLFRVSHAEQPATATASKSDASLETEASSDVRVKTEVSDGDVIPPISSPTPSIPLRQVKVLRPTVAALNPGNRPGQEVPKLSSTDAESILSTATESSLSDGSLPYEIEDYDEVLLSVRDLIEDYAGVILTGPPGTSKTWYADQIAAALVQGDPGRVRFVQFHSSYQYEDFVEGYVPRKDGHGFELKKKHLLKMCDTARLYSDRLCVMVVDELSRSDPARVFGEALTYIEPTKRGQTFHLSSGNTASIPPNLVFIATMNPMDRGVDEVDAALERRFAKIAMDPSAGHLEALLDKNSMEDRLKKSVVTFFKFLLGNSNERCKVGHAYFRVVRNEAGLRRLWDHQLRFHMAKAFPLNSEGYRIIEGEWNKIFSSKNPTEGQRKNRQDREPRW